MYPSERSPQIGPSEYVADKPVGFVGLALFALCFLCSGFELGGRALGLRSGIYLGPGATTLEIVQWLLILGTVIGCIGISLSLRWGFLLGASMPILWVLAFVIYLALYWNDLRVALEAQAFGEAYQKGGEGAPPPSPSELALIAEVGMMAVAIAFIVNAIIAVSLSLYSLLRLSGVLGRKPS